MTTRKVCVSVLALFVATVLLCQNAQAGKHEIERVSLSVPDISIEKSDRIVEFKVKMLYGFVVSVPRIPPGWFLRVELPLQWKTNVVAGSIIGVADLTSDKTDYFNDFLIVEYSKAEDEPLKIEVEITVDRYTGGKKVLLFGMEKLRMKRIDDASNP